MRCCVSEQNPTHPFQIRDYRLIWLTRFLTVSAMSAVVVVIGAQTYQVARTVHHMPEAKAAFMLGLLGLAQFIPFMLLTPIAGLLADRFDRRIIGATSIAIDFSIALTLALANSAGAVSLPLLFGLAALHGAARVFIGPSVSSIVPNVVPAELLPKAVALGSIAWQSAGVLGPALGGLLLARSGAFPYWYGSVLLGLAFFAILAVRKIPQVKLVDEPPLRQIAQGARFVWHERFLLGCVSLDLFAVLLGGATAMLPVFAYDVLHVGDEGLGLMRGAPALGAALVALWLSFRPVRHEVGAKMLWAVVVFGLATAVFGLSKN